MIPRAALAIAVAWLAAPAFAQELSSGTEFSGTEFSGTDLRDIRVGAAVAELPSAGYAGFACAATALKVTGFDGWRECPAGDDGVRALRFGYDPATSRDGTLVAGHPALLTALIGTTGTLDGLTIETDPAAPPYLRKKAFLFGQQVRSHYGADGWSCAQGEPRADEQPLGGVYVRETCTKTIAGRALRVERRLFRSPGGGGTRVVDETRVTILRTASGTTGSN